MSGPGHNGGPALEGGTTWRRHCWGRARAELLPHLPIEVLRRRVARARALGLPYRSYASIRASTGRDVIGFLFSSNALRVFRDRAGLPGDRRAHLGGIVGARRVALTLAPLTPVALLAANPDAPLDAVRPAPAPLASWAEARAMLVAGLRADGLPGDGVLLVGDTALEAGWAEAARLAGYLPAETVFGPGR